MLVFVVDELEPPLKGMEYCGATITDIDSVRHEVIHSWFGRGVFPANGNAGWIDEAIATWIDKGYYRAENSPEDRELVFLNKNILSFKFPYGLPLNLGSAHPYRRLTTRYSYFYGHLLLAELDFLFSQNDGQGLVPILSKLYLDKKLQLLTTDEFKLFLEQQSGHDLTETFTKYVYGRQLSNFPDKLYQL